MDLKHEYRKINGIETHLLLWGEVFDPSQSDVVVCVTGNPGLPDFYQEFGDYLYANLGFPVCVIGHAGHEDVPDEKSNVLKGQEHKFDLRGQIDHKIDFINSLNKNARLHLIGHSIGAWMLIEILNNTEDIRQRTASVQLLFPTLQKMAETSNGFIVNRILRTFHTLALIFVSLLFALPVKIRIFLINLYIKIRSFPSTYLNRILKYMNPRVMEKVLHLAYDEMDCVRELNREGIDKMKHCVNVIYSDRDGWVPVSLMDDLAEFEPSLKRTKVTYNHAFVLRASVKIAQMVTQFIKIKIST